jgi:hypothetical protein
MAVAGVQDVKAVRHPGECICRDGSIFEGEEQRDDEVESERYEKDDDPLA